MDKPKRFHIVLQGLKLLFCAWFGFSIAGLFYIVFLYKNLPPTDEAYGLPLSTILSSPTVLMVYQYTVVVFAIIVAPIAYWCTKNKNTTNSFLLTFTAVSVFVILSMFVFPEAAVWGSLMVALVCFLACRFSKWEFINKMKSI